MHDAPLVLVLHSDVPPDGPPDDQDTLHAAAMVADALAQKGFRAARRAFAPSLEATRALVRDLQPHCVFNLVEAIGGRAHMIHVAASFLQEIGVPYTGCSAAALFTTGDKVLAKRLMRACAIPTADWWLPPFDGLPEGRTVIVKSRIEDASLGLDGAAIVTGREAALRRAREMTARYGGAWFAEAFLDGREFNVSVLEGPNGPEVLPVPEMLFENFAEGEPKILGYASKWDETSQAYHGTRRSFGTVDGSLARRLSRIAGDCWACFELGGAARVDLRLDAKGAPFVLEVNANPGIGPEGGLQAACAEAGLTYADLIARLVEAGVRHAGRA